jgi:hypothetical protein
MPGLAVTTGGCPGEVLQRTRPSDIVGWVVMVAILLFAAMEAAGMLGFAALTVLSGQFIVAAWNILFGLIIFGIGLWLSNVAYRMVRNTGTTNAHILATARASRFWSSRQPWRCARWASPSRLSTWPLACCWAQWLLLLRLPLALAGAMWRAICWSAGADRCANRPTGRTRPSHRQAARVEWEMYPMSRPA